VDSEEATGALGIRRDQDGVQLDERNPMVKTADSIISRRRRRGRLETRALRVIVGELDLL
jgi:hypothetical protein